MSVRPDGADLKPLSDGTTNDGMPSWSPEGDKLVFRVADGSSRGLYILDVTTGERRKLETGSDRDTFPYWSPRGDWIAFTSQRDGDYEIYRIRPDGTEAARLTHFAGHDAHASISPDGEWIAFATGRQGFKDEALGLIVGMRPPPFQSYGEIAVMRIDGSDVRLLTDNSVEEGVPVWVNRAAP
jgi:Tol biopolymer transport system component